jgi:hypothetical protein
VLRFSQVTLDRIFFLRGRYSVFEITRTGAHHLQEAKRAGRGAILLGAHLGSFEAMRAGAEDDALVVNILGHFENARMINALLERINPGMAARAIHIGPGSIDFIFRVQRCIDRGEFVAALGDRTGMHEKTVTADFFGRPARFPSGRALTTGAGVARSPVTLARRSSGPVGRCGGFTALSGRGGRSARRRRAHRARATRSTRASRPARGWSTGLLRGRSSRPNARHTPFRRIASPSALTAPLSSVSVRGAA